MCEVSKFPNIDIVEPLSMEDTQLCVRFPNIDIVEPLSMEDTQLCVR